MSERNLQFSGSFNTRDLGGILTTKNTYTRFRSIIRSDAIDGFTANDWAQLANYGVRSLIDLRNEDEAGSRSWPGEFERIQIALDSGVDQQFWAAWRETGKWCTPLYYKAHLQRFPELTAAVIKTVASAKGGVLIHCGAGRDRTGLITIVLLHLAGVSTEEIAADHSLSHDNLTRLHTRRGSTDERPFIEATMRESGKTTLSAVQETLTDLDIRSLLLSNGCSVSDVTSIEARLT